MHRFMEMAPSVLLTATLLAGCAAPEPSYDRNGLYVQDWLTADQYQQIGALPLQAAGVDPIISFAVPTADGGISGPEITPGLVDAINKFPPQAGVMLAVGGWGGDNREHKAILNGFSEAARQPEAFAAALGRTAMAVEAAIHRPVTGIVDDWEFPRPIDGPSLAGMLIAQRQAMPDKKLIVAVPAKGNTEAFEAAMPTIIGNVDALHVMTYDRTVPLKVGATGVRKAGPIASRQWIVDSVLDWQRRVRDAGGGVSVMAGYPGHCYAYTGAMRAGDIYRIGRAVPLRDIDPASLQRQPDGSSAGIIDGAWTTCYTAADISDTQHQLRAASGNDVPAFYWGAKEVTANQLLAGRPAS